MTATETQLETPPAGRLVIRVKLVPQEPPPPAQPKLSKSALLATLGVVAVLLGWMGFSFFGSDPAPPPAASKQPLPKPAVEAAAPAQMVRPLPDLPLEPINRAIPAVSKSALDTIRGTIRVAVRVKIDKQGKVVGTTTEERGPSRYFERHAVDASKKWTFTPGKEEARTLLLKFNFTRFGATAETSA